MVDPPLAGGVGDIIEGTVPPGRWPGNKRIGTDQTNDHIIVVQSNLEGIMHGLVTM